MGDAIGALVQQRHGDEAKLQIALGQHALLGQLGQHRPRVLEDRRPVRHHARLVLEGAIALHLLPQRPKLLRAGPLCVLMEMRDIARLLLSSWPCPRARGRAAAPGWCGRTCTRPSPSWFLPIGAHGDDAGIGARFRLALAQHLALGIERVAGKHRMRELDVGPAEIGDRLLADVADAHADHQRHRERRGDDAAAELGVARVLLVEVQRVRVHGQQREPGVVGLA